MSYRLLLVEKRSSSRATLREALRGLGYAVVGEASDPETGVQLAHTLQPDLVFWGGGSHGGHGFAGAARIMKESPTPIILLAHRRDPETIRQATQAGVMAYLVKPVRIPELEPAIEVAIARFREFMTLWKDNQQLRTVLESRKKIERAKGLLMAREGITEAEAFNSIQRQSMKTRTRMEQVAEAILVAAAVAEGSRPRSKTPAATSTPVKGETHTIGRRES